MKKIEDYVLSIPDFPEPGIIFRDITAPPSPHADAVSAKQTASMARYIFFFIIINTPFYIPGTGVGLEESHTSDTSKRSLSISGL